MAHYHFLGIAGAFMAGAARLAAELGHEASGSDNAFYAPFGDEARRLGARLFEGYDAECEARPADCYVVGNVVSRGNPLMESILRRGRPFVSAPRFLADNVLRERHVLAVAGTHGKTTTTSLLVHLLDAAGLAPGFLAGGMLPGAGVSARLSPRGKWFVCEADEYDSAFFDKRPKFLHMQPRVAVLNNLEYDHADIYANVQEIVRQFHYLLRAAPDDGCVLMRANDANLAAARAMGCYTPVQLFGREGEGADWAWRYADGQMQILQGGAACGAPFAPPLAGAANRDNIVAAVAAAAAAGVEAANAGRLLQGYAPPLRRMQFVTEAGGVHVYDDFAHHPSAIAAALAALREARRDGRIIAVFEPRSNSMRAGVFADGLAQAFAVADAVIAVGKMDWLRAASDAAGWRLAADAAAAAELAAQMARAGDAALLMSNGASMAAAVTKELGGAERAI